MNELRNDRWQLPDGVNELLPAEAWRVETLRRQIMDNCHRWGYELVMPPLIEYLESLLTGTGETLDLQTFKIIDQHNGRTLGIRADMTTQVARMDAHALRSAYPNRLFYTGTALRARTDGAGSSRTPLQFGAELFGHAGSESDAEIIQLMLDNVMKAGLSPEELLLDMGHVGVYRALISAAGMTTEMENALYSAFIRGSRPEVNQLLEDGHCSKDSARQITTLMGLSGEYEKVLVNAQQLLDCNDSAVRDALDNLRSIIATVRMVFPELPVHIDLAELRGFRYHTGTLFTLYDATGSALARGGRYDAIGEAFGRARSATGFSGDLINLARICQPYLPDLTAASGCIWAEKCEDRDMWAKIQSLRADGERVLLALDGSAMQARDNRCERKLVRRDGEWVVESL